MELKSQDTKMIQGLSVLAMLCLHLFCKDYNGIFKPIIFIQNTPLSFYLAQLSDFCVMGFAFCSGYGHMAQHEKNDYYKKSLKRLLVLIVSYWIVVIVFSLISSIVGNGSVMPGNAVRFASNFLTLSNSYNGAWWYLFTYIILVLLSPFLLRFINRNHYFIALGISFCIYCVAFYVRFYLGASNWILEKFGPFGMTLFEYVLGVLFFKYKIFTKIYNIWNKVKYNKIWGLFILCAMLYGRTKVAPNLFFAPVTGICLIVLFHFWKKPNWVKSFFLLIGKHSTNIWLTHMFFYSVLFVDFIYIVKYPIAIYILMLVITLIVSFVLQMIQNPVNAKLKEGMKI